MDNVVFKRHDVLILRVTRSIYGEGWQVCYEPRSHDGGALDRTFLLGILKFCETFFEGLQTREKL